MVEVLHIKFAIFRQRWRGRSELGLVIVSPHKTYSRFGRSRRINMKKWNKFALFSFFSRPCTLLRRYYHCAAVVFTIWLAISSAISIDREVQNEMEKTGTKSNELDDDSTLTEPDSPKIGFRWVLEKGCRFRTGVMFRLSVGGIILYCKSQQRSEPHGERSIWNYHVMIAMRLLRGTTLRSIRSSNAPDRQHRAMNPTRWPLAVKRTSASSTHVISLTTLSSVTAGLVQRCSA